MDCHENVCAYGLTSPAVIGSAANRRAESFIKMKSSFVGRSTVPMAARVRLGKVYSWVTDLMSSAILMTSCIIASAELSKFTSQKIIPV